jgi:hypothetical protein
MIGLEADSGEKVDLGVKVFFDELEIRLRDNFSLKPDTDIIDSDGIKSYRNGICGLAAGYSSGGYLVVAVTASPDMGEYKRLVKQDATIRVQENLENGGYGSCEVRPLPRANLLVFGNISSRELWEVQPRVLLKLPYRDFA